MNQNRPIIVCSGERLTLSILPSSRISLTSSVQVSEVSAGGAAGRNCEPLAITQGVTAPDVENNGTTVGIYTPAVVWGRYVSWVPIPSFARSAIKPAAAFFPTSMPFAFG